MTNVLYTDDWTTLSFDPASGLVRYVRTANRYVELTDVDRSFAGVATIGPRLVPGLKLLIDVRLAPPRNDAGFEAKTNAALARFVAPFAKYALLVGTAVGKLQTLRLAHERGVEPHVFDDERAALAYLGVST